MIQGGGHFYCDAEALLREVGTVISLVHRSSLLCFNDAAFALCGQALYRTPQPPLADAMPASIVQVDEAKRVTLPLPVAIVRGICFGRFCMQQQTPAMSTAATKAVLTAVTAIFCLQ
jgi:hypothetical protein